jgi:hydrogenase maturation protein HypF
VCDIHPGYVSRRWAATAAAERGIPLVEVQHHHAHIAAIMAEHGLDGSQPVLGFSFDGTGYGTDGAIWGGEVILADYGGFRRLAHLRYVPLPGGDSAIKHPYRCALAYLWAAGIAWDADLPPVAAAPPWELQVLRRQLETGLSCVPCSSMGRLFDAVASLIGLRHSVSYEAQAAIEMEALLPQPEPDGSLDLRALLTHRRSDPPLPSERIHAYVFVLREPSAGGECLLIDPGPMIAAIVEDLRHGTPPAVIAARFHAAVAAAVVALSLRFRQGPGQPDSLGGMDTVALTGGVLQNVRFLALAMQALRSQGFTVLTHRVVPPNDGGLALGQAIIGGKAHVAAR